MLSFETSHPLLRCGQAHKHLRLECLHGDSCALLALLGIQYLRAVRDTPAGWNIDRDNWQRGRLHKAEDCIEWCSDGRIEGEAYPFISLGDCSRKQERTEDGIHNDILLLEARFELGLGLYDRDPEVLDLLEEPVVDVFGAGFGEIYGGFIAEHVEMSGSDETVSSLVDSWLPVRQN